MIKNNAMAFNDVLVKFKDLESIAVETDLYSITYQELYKKIIEVSETIRDATPTKTVVAIVGHSSIEMVIYFFAVIKSGRAVLLIDKDWSNEWRDVVLNDVRPSVLVEIKEEVALSQQKITLYSNSPQLVPDDAAYIIYTSGTTGKPKGSINSVGGLVNLFKAFTSVFSVDKTDIVLQFSSPSFDAWISDVCLALTNEARLAIPNHKCRLPGSGLEECIKTRHVTVATLPPSVLHYCHSADFLTIRTLIVVGERCSIDLIKKWFVGRNMYNAYGPSETTVCSTVYKLSSTLQPPSIGEAVPGVKIWLEDEDHKVIDSVGRGQLVIGGNGVGLGYLGREDLTRDKFSFSQNAFYTGDIVFRDTDFLLYYEGRLDNQVKINGVRIELDRVEELLETHEKVSVATAAKSNFRDRDIIIAFVVLKEKILAETTLRKELSEISKNGLPANVIPRIVFINELPLRGSGKIDKKYLLSQYQNQKTILSDGNKDAINLQEKICLIFSEDLSLQLFLPTDDYFLMGGDSLGMIRCLSEIGIFLGKKLDPSIGMEFSNPASLAEALVKDRNISKKENALYLNDIPNLDLHQIKRITGDRKDIFLTGATGLLGAYVIKEFLDTSEGCVRCLVRADSNNDAYCRVKKNLEKHDLWSEVYSGRIVCYLGSLSQEHFGLGLEDYTDIIEAVSHVYHLAANVSWVLSYKILEPTNVIGTKNAIQMCADSGVKLVYVSSIGVYHTQNWRSLNKFDESNISKVGDHHLGYLRSKWASEHLVISAIDAGIPCYIFRPPFICSGVTHVNRVASSDFLQSKINACIELGCIPEGGFHLDIYPADLLASNIVLIAKNDTVTNRMFNFSNPNKLIWSKVKNVFAELGYDFPLVNYKDWLDRIESVENSMSQHLAFVGRPSEDEISIYEHSHGEWPLITEDNVVEALGNFSMPSVLELIKKYIPRKNNNL